MTDSPGTDRQQTAAAPELTEEDEDLLVQQQLVAAVENQLLAGDPPAVQAVLNKLLLVGTPREEAIEMMAYVLAVEVQQTFIQERSFDVLEYERMLRALPELPVMPDANP